MPHDRQSEYSVRLIFATAFRGSSPLGFFLTIFQPYLALLRALIMVRTHDANRRQRQPQGKLLEVIVCHQSFVSAVGRTLVPSRNFADGHTQIVLKPI